MFRRLSVTVLAAGVVTAMAAGPAAAQGVEVLVSAPSADEVCTLLEELGDEGVQALEELTGSVEELEGFEPEAVDDDRFADLDEAMRGVLDANEGALGASAIYGGEALLISVVPDLTDCDAVDDDQLTDPGMEPGTYLIQPDLDEVCALLEESLEQLEDEIAEGDLPEDGAPEDGAPEGDGALEGFVPEPVTGDDLATYQPVGDAMTALLDGEDEADEATASLAEDTLVVGLLPNAERCELADPVQDDAPGEDVPAPSEVPAGVEPSGTALPWLVLAGMIVGALLLATGLVTSRRPQ